MFPGELTVGVRVAVDVFVGTPTVGVRVVVGVFVSTGAFVGVDVGVCVREGVAVGPLVPSVMTSSGAAVPSREENVIPSLLSATRANVYVPLPVTRDVTSYSTQVSTAIAPLLSTAPLKRAGCVFQLTPPVPDSVHVLFAR